MIEPKSPFLERECCIHDEGWKTTAMKVVHPAFDGVWFIQLDDGTMVEAATLRELRGKLGAGYRIRDYYPHGYAAAFTPLSYEPQARVGNKKKGPRKREQMEVAVSTRGDKWPPELVVQAVELSNQGWSTAKIGRQLGKTRGAVIGVLFRNKQANQCEPTLGKISDDQVEG